MSNRDNSEFRTRVAMRLAALNMSMRAASPAAGMSADTLGKFLSGENRSLRATNMASLARVLDVSESWLMGSTDDPANDTMPFGVRFGGTVEAGAFRTQDLLDQTGETIRVPIAHDWRYPAAAQFAFKVVGDSMNKADIFEGMHVLAIDVHAWERGNGPPRDGSLVIVARMKNGGPERELTIKRLRITAKQMMLEPESTNPTHKPITFPMPHSSDETTDGDRAEIIAVCLQAVRILA